MANIHFHPDHDLLSRYANGELESATSILISAHLEFCPNCRRKLAAIEAKQARHLASSEPAVMSPSLSAMMLEIMSQEPSEPAAEELASSELVLDDKTYPLPSVLRRHSDKIGPWSRLPGNIKRAQVEVSGSSKMNFIYMDEAVRCRSTPIRGKKLP